MNMLSRLQRELPDTDKDRYDVAYERGRTQARSSTLFGGLILGALLGALMMFLLDPAHGAGRRAQLASRANGIKKDLSKSAAGRAEDLQNRAKGAAIEAGVMKPSGDARTARRSLYDDADATAPVIAMKAS
jgi:gas vesicle protein